jgi:hypothetical protein
MGFTFFIFWICFSCLVGILGRGRNIGFFIPFFVSIILSPIIGLVVALFSHKKNSVVDEQEVYLWHLENAKKYEYKGQIDKAIDSYMDSMYHLENDYKFLPILAESARKNKITEIKAIVEKLKLKI